jgi:phosphonate transport system ATP-binding protein
MNTLVIQSLSKRFGNTLAVDGVSLSVAGGEFVGIIGRSGAGKSTLLRLINRLNEPTDGSVRFDATQVTALEGRALREWRRDCAMVFQQFNLVGRLDVLTNVLMGRLTTVPTWRALMQQPKIILADEPIASLDPRNTQLVMDALAAINRDLGITVLCNLHSLDIARSYCQRLVGMTAGRVVFDGVPAALTEDMVRALYGVEASMVSEVADLVLEAA